MKGIVLAGGRGTRLYPMTKVVSKQLMPIYDKPLIYYPLSVLMIAGIKDILIISTPQDIDNYKKLLQTGSDLGINITYKVQDKPGGIAEAFLVGEEFIGDDSVCLILGDNVFYGGNLTAIVEEASQLTEGATVFAYPVKNPSDFGIVEFDENFKALSIEEKPKFPKSNYAVPGLYFYDNKVIDIAKNISASGRGELEITTVNMKYLQSGKLNVKPLGRGMAWLDTGTPSGMMQAGQYVEAIQNRQGLYVACIEEIAWRKGYISKEKLYQLGEELKMTDYGQYLLSL